MTLVFLQSLKIFCKQVILGYLGWIIGWTIYRFCKAISLRLLGEDSYQIREAISLNPAVHQGLIQPFFIILISNLYFFVTTKLLGISHSVAHASSFVNLMPVWIFFGKRRHPLFLRGPYVLWAFLGTIVLTMFSLVMILFMVKLALSYGNFSLAAGRSMMEIAGVITSYAIFFCVFNMLPLPYLDAFSVLIHYDQDRAETVWSWHPLVHLMIYALVVVVRPTCIVFDGLRMGLTTFVVGLVF